MNIGFDINEANIPQRVGVNQVAYNTFLHLVKQVQGNDVIYALGKERPLPDMPVGGPNLVYEIFGSKKAWVLTSLTKRLWWGKPKIDVLFSPSHYTPLFTPVNTVIYLMDMSFERFGTEYFTNYDINQLKKWTPLSVKKAKKILTISEFSKDEIVKLYGTDPNKVEVVYPAIDREIYHGKIPKTKVVSVKKKYGITGSYLLYWGTLQPRKNINRLIEAFSKLDKPQLKLVICGKKGWLYDEILEQSKNLGISNRVVFTGFAPNEDLTALIKGSRAFVLPSLYEGFGMPVVEAQAVGTPVVVSKVSSLPEIAGESGIFIEDPLSTESIKEALDRVINLSLAERIKLVKMGKENTKRFDWDLSAQKILNILKNV
ncbi:MAG TPA: glycosyltransferase family 1 protein [Candidatus Woesebacteria bacterium]|nr:glycosyltransferase family 1 protein [Candidatus Woesebacteria bacterium]